jgi:hypothetical protein
MAQDSNKKNVYVQTISDGVMKIYENLPKMVNQSKDTRLGILKSTKVRSRALIRSLENYIRDCKSSELKQDVQNVIYSIEDMLHGGETRLYVCHTKRNIKTELEFVCVAVRMYKYDGETVCDYCMATYSYAKSVDTGLAVVGGTSIGTGVAFGLFAFATGGAGAVVLGCIGGALGLFGAGATATAFDTSVTGDMKELLEASFLHELVTRGHAMIGTDRRLYITNE